MKLAFYGRVSTEDAQDPEVSRSWQLSRAMALVAPNGGEVVEEFFDIGQSRSLPWGRRPEATRLLAAIADPARGFEGVVIGEPQRAFYGNQFSLTFPVLTHYGVSLWVPEVGGCVDPDSEAHDLVMSLFGGMSKGERSRIRTRTRLAMTELAKTSDRHLGGRPPYGYLLADVGPHPNPSKAAAGQRAHRLAVDPATAPTVQWIFRSYAAGMGLRSMADELTGRGVPSPSEYDRARNSHRDPRGWSHSAIRAILDNPTYTGVRMWGKAEKVEQLVSVQNVALGTQMTMKHVPPAQWINPQRKTHEAIVDDSLWELVQARKKASARGTYTRARKTDRLYMLSGLVTCAHCERRMAGSYRQRDNGDKRIMYRCEVGKSRTSIEGHPRSVYLRESHACEALDGWICETLADPEFLAQGQQAAPVDLARMRLEKKLRATDAAIANLVAAIEAGAGLDVLVQQLQSRQAERELIVAEMAQIPQEAPSMSVADVGALVEQVGGLASVLRRASDEQRAQVYRSLGISLAYNAEERLLDVGAALTPGGCLTAVSGGGIAHSGTPLFRGILRLAA